MRWIAITTILWIFSISCEAQPASVAFYYGSHVPVRQLQLFNTVVVDPRYISTPKENETKQSHWYARVYGAQLNLKNISTLWSKGYRGFFLDSTSTNIKLIQAIKKSYPAAKLIVNSRIEQLSRIKQKINGVVSKPLYFGYKKNSYVLVDKNTRKTRLAALNKAKSYGLDSYVIEYLPLIQQKKARLIAKRISGQGFIPWVSNKRLTGMGVSSIHVIPREIMVLYSSKQFNNLIISYPLRYLSMPLDYLGYIPHMYDIEKPLPNYELVNRTSGIVLWLDGGKLKKPATLVAWLERAASKKIPILLLGNIDFLRQEKSFLKHLGIKFSSENKLKDTFTIGKLNQFIMGFEEKITANSHVFYPVKAAGANVLLNIKNGNHQSMDAVAITPWGGYALAPYILDALPNKQVRYLINPFTLLQKTLRLAHIPVPDVTSENGRRILFVHVDGDGFYSRSEWPRGPFAGETLLQTILDKYRIPTTVSVVEGEIGPTGLKPKDSPKLERIARKIFKLPWVEIANHSYSHPFFWKKAYKNTGKVMGEASRERLHIPNYHFNLTREITVSTKDINHDLSSPNKKCKVFLWTGDTDPPPEAVAMTYKLGLLNMNNGDTIISHDYPSLAAVTGLGVYKGKYLQVFAPIQNENLYTHEWLGPFYGFKRVVETFQMTDKPRRLKPIDIYYHFYSATKISALKALDFVYDWALKQSAIPEFSSNYIQDVQDYYQLVVAKSSDGWLVHGNGHIREFRVSGVNSYPQLNTSVVGFNTLNHNHYVHTAKAAYHEIRLQKTQPDRVYLHDSNAQLLSYTHSKNQYTWQLKSYVPLEVNFSNAKKCQFLINGRPIQRKSKDKRWAISLVKEKEAKIQAVCRS